MFKRVLVAIGAVALGAAAFAFAAPGEDKERTVTPLTGTVASIDGLKVEVTVEGEKPAWVKKGGGVKFEGGLGKIVDVSATSVTFRSKKASALSAGQQVTLEKGKVVPAGC